MSDESADAAVQTELIILTIALTADGGKGDHQAAVETEPDDRLLSPVGKRRIKDAARKQESTRPALATQVSLPRKEEKARILLVEDDLPHQAYVKAILDDLGYEISVAQNGKHAIDALRNGSYSLVLMDCEMPEMDGWTAARLIADMRARQEIPNIPVIALTAHQAEGDVERCFECGMDDYIAKTVWKTKWKDQIGTILNKWILTSAQRDSGRTAYVSLDPSALMRMQDVMRDTFDLFLSKCLAGINKHVETLTSVHGTDKRIDDVALAAHSLKSLGALIGAMQLSNVSARIEEGVNKIMLDGGDITHLRPLVSEAETIFADVKVELKNNLRR